MLTMRCRCFVVCMVHDGVGGAVSRCFCGARGADRALVVIRIARGLYGAGSVLNVCTLLFMCAVECSCCRHDAGRRACRAEGGGGASGSFGQRINTTWLSRAKYGRRVAWSVWLVLLWVSHCCLLVCLFVLFAFRVLMVIVAIVAIAFGAYGAGTLRSTRERPSEQHQQWQRLQWHLQWDWQRVLLRRAQLARASCVCVVWLRASQGVRGGGSMHSKHQSINHGPV